MCASSDIEHACRVKVKDDCVPRIERTWAPLAKKKIDPEIVFANIDCVHFGPADLMKIISI